MRELGPDLPLVVISEFPPPAGEWIQFHILRSGEENLELCRARLEGREIHLAAIVHDPERPYRELRALAFRLTPLTRIVVFDRAFRHFTLHPRDSAAILRHGLRSALDTLRQAGAWLGKWWFRLTHPEALRRPLFYRTSLAAGAVTAWLKRRGSAARLELGPELPAGLSVVIPSRNGRELLERCLPLVTGADEVIVVDNGSEDDTAGFLRECHPAVIVEHSPEPLSFARAVNRGIARAVFSHVCLLNNDMVVEAGFLEALREAFDRVPDLFCATAQIFLPEGQRREETGKAVMPAQRAHDDFPLRCELPVEGENYSYVLYGSGGASLYDTRKLRALGGVAVAFDPAYVEDLDLGFNGWRMGWPTVFVAGARALHYHRSTTSRYFSESQLNVVMERHYLRFLARSITDSAEFRTLWREAIWRINLQCAHRPELVQAMGAATLAPAWMEPHPPAVLPDREIFALGSGALAAFPGCAPRGRPLVMVVSPYVPYPLSHGGAVRMFNLMRRAAAEFDQVLVCFVDELEPAPPELTAICVEVVYVRRFHTHAHPSTERPDVVEEFDSPVMRAVLKQTVRKWRPSIAQLEFTQMAQYVDECSPARTLLVEHDITLDLYAQLLVQRDDWETRRQYERWVRFEYHAWGRVDRIVTMSEKDRRATGRAQAVTIANGVDIERFQPSDDPPDPRRILFIGSFAHLPNVLAIDFFLREAWPLLKPLRTTLHIIAGSRPEFFLERYKDRVQPQLNQPGIELEGFVSDVRPAYRRAAVVIAPLLASAGTNIKIMEAMAMGKAIVSTPAGINGLNELEHGRDVIVVNEGKKMAYAIAALIDDPAARQRLETEARRTAAARYDWEVIATQQKQLYRDLLSL
jgi:glycosyltransferase involved in cell wall biosynthesis/GT2 family glycosyltransferase